MLNIYKKDPVLQEGDFIQRGEVLVQVTKLERDKIWCSPTVVGDLVIEEDPFVWEGRYTRVWYNPREWAQDLIDLWAMRPMTKSPLLSMTGDFTQRFIEDDGFK